MKKIATIVILLFKNFSILRIFQILETKKLFLKGKSLEFGAYANYKKNFSYYTKSKSNFHYSNIENKQNKKIIKLDLRKKLKIKSKSYDNIFLYNVLEHIDDHSITFNELKRILNKNGNLFGSTPFLYQVHGAPKDYFRFTEDFLREKFEKNGFKKIKIKCLGFGPFVACFSILQAYTKYLPLINHLILLACYIFDFILQIFIKTKLNKIYPIGIFFSVKNR
jgi:SAM-dependent methyltransferase